MAIGILLTGCSQSEPASHADYTDREADFIDDVQSQGLLWSGYDILDVGTQVCESIDDEGADLAVLTEAAANMDEPEETLIVEKAAVRHLCPRYRDDLGW